MVRYILKRVVQTVTVMLLVSFITFLLVSVMPKDPVYSLFGSDVTPDEYQILFRRLGLDQPVLVRYWNWLRSILSGDFGTSYAYKMPVMDLVGQKIGVTMYLSIVSTLISFPLGMLFGVITAVKRGKWQDNVFTFLANIMGSIPGFVIAIVVLWVFCVQLKWLPSSGFAFPWVDFQTHIRTIIMPMFCLVIGGVAGVTRQTRSSMLEAIRQDYVRTARSKGLKENYIIKKHVLRNGLVPIITLIGGRLAMMIGGSVFIENVFSIPGMGALMVNSVNKVDVPVIQICVLLTAGCISLSYLLTDLLYLAVDPRISLE